MVPIAEIVDRFATIRERRSSVYRECRHCGTAISEGDDCCPNCGSECIAEFAL